VRYSPFNSSNDHCAKITSAGVMIAGFVRAGMPVAVQPDWIRAGWWIASYPLLAPTAVSHTRMRCTAPAGRGESNCRVNDCSQNLTDSVFLLRHTASGLRTMRGHYPVRDEGSLPMRLIYRGGLR
jgi:hypothetical protein